MYGLPGIASKISTTVQVSIQEAETTTFDIRPFNGVVHKEDKPDHVVCRVFDALFSDLDLPPLEIIIQGDCLPQAGMGYSAACCTSLVQAVNQFTESNWSAAEQERRVYLGEQITHGTPSGIDNACAKQDTLIWFEKDKPIIPLTTKTPLPLLVIDTGKRHDTKEAVAHVRQLKEEKPDLFSYLFEAEQLILTAAKELLAEGQLDLLGHLLLENQELLEHIEVSTPEIKEIIEFALKNGALGAKLTGAGMGGCVIALCKNTNDQAELKERFQKEKYTVLDITIK